MPRDGLSIDIDLQRLSVLAEDGTADEELAPDVDHDELVRWFRLMLLTRRFERRRLELQRQGRIGTFAPAIGQEAAQIGAVAALAERDWLVPSFRETAAVIMRGVPLASLLLYDAGYNEGADVPADVHVLPIAVPVSSQIPHAVGLAYAADTLEAGEVVMVFFGEGATSEGDFHEAVNFAGIHDCPVVFVCQNNQYAISTPVAEQTASPTIAQKAVAHGIPGVQVDGNDVLGVHVAAREAVERARRGDGPTLLECVTYRLSVHTTADDPSKYRPEEEVEAWRERDPLERFRRYLAERGLADEEVDQLESDIADQLAQAWADTETRISELGGAEVMFDHVYADLPPYLAAQRSWVTDGRAS